MGAKKEPFLSSSRFSFVSEERRKLVCVEGGEGSARPFPSPVAAPPGMSHP